MLCVLCLALLELFITRVSLDVQAYLSSRILDHYQQLLLRVYLMCLLHQKTAARWSRIYFANSIESIPAFEFYPNVIPTSTIYQIPNTSRILCIFEKTNWYFDNFRLCLTLHLYIIWYWPSCKCTTSNECCAISALFTNCRSFW